MVCLLSSQIKILTQIMCFMYLGVIIFCFKCLILLDYNLLEFYDVSPIFYFVKMKIRTWPNCLIITFADCICIKLIRISEASQPFTFSPILCIEIIKIIKKSSSSFQRKYQFKGLTRSKRGLKMSVCKLCKLSLRGPQS